MYATKDLKFIKNIVTVDVDGSKGMNHYTITAMYDLVQEDGFAVLVQKVIDEFDYSWDEIEKDGGISQINADIRESYGIC